MTTTEQASTRPTTPQRTIDSYFECWNATTDEQRSNAVAKTWTEDATSTDPMADVSGHAALSDMFTGTQAMYPDHTFRQVGALDTHHSLLRWGWEMVDAEGTKVLDGIDVAELAEDGRLSRLAGFFGANPPEAAA